MVSRRLIMSVSRLAVVVIAFRLVRHAVATPNAVLEISVPEKASVKQGLMNNARMKWVIPAVVRTFAARD
jgi:hypothetical protein